MIKELDVAPHELCIRLRQLGIVLEMDNIEFYWERWKAKPSRKMKESWELTAGSFTSTDEQDPDMVAAITCTQLSAMLPINVSTFKIRGGQQWACVNLEDGLMTLDHTKFCAYATTETVARAKQLIWHLEQGLLTAADAMNNLSEQLKHLSND